jgi:hypothetical protein
MPVTLTRLRRLWPLTVALLVAAAVLLAIQATPAAAVTGQLVSNGTFSSGTAGWNIPSAGGVETCCAAPTNGYPNAFFHPNGAGSGTGLNGYLVTWQNIAGAPSGSYTLTGRLRTSGPPQSAILQADSGTFEAPYCRTAGTGATGWAQVTCTFNYTAGAILHVAFGTSNLPATNGGWVAFDDISLIGSGGGGTGETAPYDLARYVIRADGTNGPVYHDSKNENLQLQASGGRYYQAKNQHWEEIWADATSIYRYRDTSDANTWYGLYNSAGAQGDVWIARFVSPGYTLTRTPTIRVYNKAGCTAAPGWGTDSSQISFTRYLQTWTSPGGITLNNVIELQSKHVSNTGALNLWEDYYYGEGYGLVAFYAYDYNAPGSAPNFQGWIDSTTGTTPVRESVCTP